MQESQIKKDIINIIKKYENGRSDFNSIIIKEKDMQKVTKDIGEYLQKENDANKKVITYSEHLRYGNYGEHGNHTLLDLKVYINDPGFKKIASFEMLNIVAIDTSFTFKVDEVGTSSLFELLNDTEHEFQLYIFAKKFAEQNFKISENKYKKNNFYNKFLEEERQYYNTLDSYNERRIYTKAVSYTLAKEELFKPLKELVKVYGLETLNSYSDYIKFNEQ